MDELQPTEQPLRAWTCSNDSITAEARHPVQFVHIQLGQEDEYDGRRRRVIAKDIIGAELVVFHESVT
jgi:hypothetical protein